MRKGFAQVISLTLAISYFFGTQTAFAAMSSANYQILWDEFSTGGGQGSSASYLLRDSVGGGGLQATSASYVLDSGFRGGLYDQVVNFSPRIQDRSSQVAATNFASNIVTVTTTSGIVVDDWVLLVQNEGASQVAGMGKVTAVDATTITLASPLAGGTPTIDGVSDYVYEMSSSGTPGFGTLSTSALALHSVGWVANADVVQGYNAYVFEDGDLRTGEGAAIADVTDGQVSAGDSEYGARSSDSSLALSSFDTEDSAITSSPQQVASVSANPFESAGFVTLKVGIDSTQQGGSYGQTLSIIFVGDY